MNVLSASELSDILERVFEHKVIVPAENIRDQLRSEECSDFFGTEMYRRCLSLFGPERYQFSSDEDKLIPEHKHRYIVNPNARWDFVHHKFYFSDANDAMLFKLMWGGL